MKQTMTIDDQDIVQKEDVRTWAKLAPGLRRRDPSVGKVSPDKDKVVTSTEHIQNCKEIQLAAGMTYDSRKPHILYIAMLSVIALSEFLLMLALPDLPDLSKSGKAFLDACLLSMITGPILFGFFFKPLQTNIEVRKQTEIEHEKIQEMDRTRSEFVSIAGHELRTPLSVIRGYAELMLMKKMFDDNSRTEFASIINEKTHAMERLIDDLLDTNRIQSGRPLLIQKEQHNLIATIASTINDYRRGHSGRPFLIRLPEEPVSFAFDPLRITQILENLLSNAIKFSPEGSPVEIEGFLHNEVFQLQIRDRGIGMTPMELSQVFDKFYRADTSNTSASGLGLGMAIVKELIEAHSGTIWIESQGGEGTKVSFALPIKP